MNDIFKGSPFWQEIRTGLFVIREYDWRKTLLALPQLIDANDVVTRLQTTTQILNSNFSGRSFVKGLPVEAKPDAGVLAQAMPPEGSYNQENLFLQWMYHYYVLEGVCVGFKDIPLGEWGPSMHQLIEQTLQFLVYIAAVMGLLEDGTIKGVPTKEGMVELLPLVEFKLKKITETLLSKTADYGESYRRHGLQGSIPRLWDKVARYAQLSALGRTANYEPKADALKDLLGYSVIAWSLVHEIYIEQEVLSSQGEIGN
jgi:hypothetical protein